MNNVNLIGNVGQMVFDNLKEDSSACVIFSLATSEKYHDKAGNEVVKTQWHKIKVFGNMAVSVRKTVDVGRRLFIAGQIEYEEYKDKNGIDRIGTTIRMNQYISSWSANDRVNK